MERRSFFRLLGGTAGGLALSRSLSICASAEEMENRLSTLTDDDAYWRFVKRQFLLYRDWTFLNTGGLGASPYTVLDYVKVKMDLEESLPNAGHDEKEWWEAKGKCATLLGPTVKKEELAFTSTATEGINIVVNGLPLQRGDEVITSTHEHPALRLALLNRMQRMGIVIKTFEPDLKSGLGNVERIDRLISKKTKLIFLSHITCTTGQCFPEKEINALGHARKLWVAWDGVQVPGMIPLDLKGAGVDFYAISGHKWMLGPKRTGILYVRPELLDTLRPTYAGALTDKRHDLMKKELELHPTSQRYEYGTQNEALFFGLGIAADYVNAIGLERIWEHDRKLAEMFYEGAGKIPGVEFASPEEPEYRTAMISIRHPRKKYNELVNYLNEKKIRTRPVSDGVDAVRVSFHVYNLEEDVGRILDELKKIT